MKKLHFISFIFIVFVSCTGNDKETTASSSANSVTAQTSTEKHVNWEIGDAGYVNKIVEWYKLWDEKKPFVASDLFADTFRLHIPEVGREIVVPNDQIADRMRANRDLYHATSNVILSSVALHDKVSGEDWVMVTAYSKWTEEDGKKDSILYHDDWRFVNGKANLLISFYTTPPKGFSPKKDK